MFALRRRSWLHCLAVLATMTGCIPYTVGHTAKPAKKKEVKFTTSLFSVDKNKETFSQPSGWNYLGIDIEGRAGVSDRADVGVRVTSGSGVVLSYMRRLNGTTEDPGASISAKFGAGVIDFPSIGMVEAALLASADDVGRFTPYGGLRVVQTHALDAGYLDGGLTAGGFFGTRIGDSRFGISPEIGVFYDRPLPGVKRKDLLIVPSISIHGNYVGWLARRLLGR